MAAHRKTRAHRKDHPHPLTGTATRTATTLVLAGAAVVTAFQGTGAAEPVLTPAQIKARVDELYQEAEVATEHYNGARERAARERAALDRLRDEAVRSTERLNTARHALGSIATAQYRAGGIDPGLQLVLSSDPDEYLERAAFAAHIGDRQAASVASAQQELRHLTEVRERAGRRSAALGAHQRELSRHKKTVQRRLAAAERLLNTLPSTHGTPRTASVAPVLSPTTGTRAAHAVAYAYRALGKPYVWGATGPGAFDCSGLTRAAWQAAGISLPRTTYSQIDAGQRVSRAALAPGDLVFFYSGVSHVGLYVGAGKMIHSPRPGGVVRIASIDEMPFAGASRPG
ncbi:C40 family peptidase [Streptomyces albipurpureus]|uniref:C40 family peptidase n=1 Tax=Streptomyces albipurpureus TaxID=2897419 RepID=A0ABT0ULB7_9ACTN|nr:C40 family peptidase [Streptomyces sp. CWNU-1]MCM2389404.1 C40 family peptidase [Streptomyces sp. CWNU-1]